MSVFGAYAGVGLTGTLSNGLPGQLRGPFRSFNVDVGLGDLNFDMGIACSGHVCVASISPPGLSAGVGLLVTTMTTDTAVTTKQCQ